MAICAYCAVDSPLTREHVTPKFVYQYLKIEGKHVGWNRRMETWKSNLENVTKDVCAKCNNGPLAELDAYGKQFFEINQLHDQRYEKSLVLRYDFQLLSRWLLKISFNASRASTLGLLDHDKYLSYILNGKPSPDFRYLCLRCELLKPLRVADYPDLESIGTYTVANERYINPLQFRLFTLKPTASDPWVARCIQIGGVMFHLQFVDQRIRVGYVAASRRKYAKMQPGSIVLPDRRDKVRLTACSRTWLEAIWTDDFVDRLDAWEP
jgi:hypothetical protein